MATARGCKKTRGCCLAAGLPGPEKMALLLQPICDKLVISVNPEQHD
jgi:hypothetical protein